MTHFHSVPAAGSGIVILTNSERSWPLFAKVLTDWAKWSGHGSVKFSRITLATIVLQALIGAVVLFTLWQLYRLMHGLWSGKRKWAPLSKVNLSARLFQAAAGIAIVAALAWSVAQPYLFVSSIFPSTVSWGALSMLIFALTMSAMSLFPHIEGKKIEGKKREGA
jgi:hypothetical protein